VTVLSSKLLSFTYQHIIINAHIYLTAVYHSQSGPVSVSDLSWTTPLVNAFLAAGQVLGYPIRDLNGRQQTGMLSDIILE
jgi:Choline dehydrogenase and related flavoproteins